MTTFGHMIAASFDDGAVNIYDSVTGVLMLFLTPRDPIQALRGSPDGSLLFCIHQAPSITLWDTQTGGLIHTFVLEQKVENAAISLEGRYLAGGFPDGSVKIWEIANKVEGVEIQSGSPVTHICWLEPGKHLVVVGEVSVSVWDIDDGKVLHHFEMHGAACDAVYSPKLDRLAILTASEAESTITIIYPHTGTYSPYIIRHQLTCLAFSQTAEELVCGMNTPGLQLFDVSTQNSRPFDHPTTVTSLSILSNGTVVANTTDSGVQLLCLDQAYAPSEQPIAHAPSEQPTVHAQSKKPIAYVSSEQPTVHALSEQPTIHALTVQPFDEDRVLAVIPVTRDSIVLLKPASMSLLLTIPARKNIRIPETRTAILCASYETGQVVHCFEEGSKENMQLWKFTDQLPGWTVEVDELPSIGRISPTGARLVTCHDGRHQTYICIWSARDGKLEEKIVVDPPRLARPFEIIFRSDDEFFIQNDTHRIIHDISWSQGAPNRSITRVERSPMAAQLQRYYDVDDNLEWVVSDAKRICWIPPGYIRSAQNSYCWVGHSLVMVGQDGTLRKLTFREPTVEGRV